MGKLNGCAAESPSHGTADRSFHEKTSACPIQLFGHPCGLHEYNQLKPQMHEHVEKGSFLTYQLNRIWTAVKLEGNGGKHSGRFIPVLEYAKTDAASVSHRK